MFKVVLPFLGERWIFRHPTEEGHFLWSSVFGLHDCSSKEDKLIQEHLKEAQPC